MKQQWRERPGGGFRAGTGGHGGPIHRRRRSACQARRRWRSRHPPWRPASPPPGNQFSTGGLFPCGGLTWTFAAQGLYRIRPELELSEVAKVLSPKLLIIPHEIISRWSRRSTFPFRRANDYYRVGFQLHSPQKNRKRRKW